MALVFGGVRYAVSNPERAVRVMAETMTPAERLRKFVVEYKKMQSLDQEQVYALHSEIEPRFAPLLLVDIASGADALDRLAQTCGNCQHADDGLSPDGLVYCAAPATEPHFANARLVSKFPFAYRTLPADERCKGWTKREDA